MSKYEARPIGPWGRLVLGRWAVLRPPGRLGRMIRFHPVITGFTVTVNDRWHWLVLWPHNAWYYRRAPVHMKPMDLSIDWADD